MIVKYSRLLLMTMILLAILSSLTSAAPRLIRILINDIPLTTEVPPRIENGRVLVPVRAVTEALGATVDWDESNRTVLITPPSRFVRYEGPAMGGPIDATDYAALGAVMALRRYLGDRWPDLATQDSARVLIRYEILYLRNTSGSIAPLPLREWEREQQGDYWVRVRLYFGDFTRSPVKPGITLWKEREELSGLRQRTLGHESPAASRYWYEEREFRVRPQGESVLRESTDGGVYTAELEQGTGGWEVVPDGTLLKEGPLQAPPVLNDAVTADLP